MNKKLFWGVVVIVIIIILVGWSDIFETKSVQNSNSPIKIGVIAPLSGDFAMIGKELQRGVDLSLEQLNSGGKNITAVYEDDKFDLKEVVTAANKLINVDKVDFVILFSVTEAKPVIPIFNEKKIPLVVLWDSNEFLSNAGPYIYSSGFSTEKAGQKMADFAYNTLNLRRLAILHHNESWSEIIVKAFEDEFLKVGGKIVYKDSVNVGTNDFRSIIPKIKAVNPDGIYSPLIPFDSVAYFKQAKALGLNIVLMSGDVFIKDVVDAAGPSAEGVYYTNAYLEYPELATLYKEKYGADSYGIFYTAAAYDGVMKISQTLNSKINLKENFDTFFGPRRTLERQEKIYQIKNGESVRLDY